MSILSGMSMLSAKRDRLRNRAKEIKALGEAMGAAHVPNGLLSVVLLTIDATDTDLRDAADTIWDLRNKCCDLMDERDEMRHENADLKRQLRHADEIIGRQGTKIEKSEDENERLREYVAAIAPAAYKGQLSCTSGLYECEFFNQCYNNEPTKHDGRGCKWVIWARELGIEVSE